MIKGLAITPPILGRISIGMMVEQDGKRRPQKNDQFTITTQIQTKEGWRLHPLDEQLRKQQSGKLRSIPIRLPFNDPDLNLRVQYSFFDSQTARPLCVGNGEQCKRQTPNGLESLPCPSPGECTFAQNHCKPYARLNVIIGDDDPLGTFMFRTTGFNSIRTLAARLQYFSAMSGNRLAYLPLMLKLRGKSTRQSYGQPIYYVDITLRDDLSLEETLRSAKDLEAERFNAGFNQKGLDDQARIGFANGAFEDSEEDTPAIVEEFYPAPESPTQTAPSRQSPTSLNEKLNQKAQAFQAPTRPIQIS